MSRAARIAVPVLVVLAIAAQAAASSLATPTTGAETGAVLGQASFAYVSSLRTFVAAVLWNRMEPQIHAYYEDKPIEDYAFMLPTMHLVLQLDPEFKQAYYVAPWIIAKCGDVDGGLRLAKRGTEALPGSALLHASYAQMLVVFRNDSLTEAVGQANTSLRSSWSDPEEEYIGLGMCRAVYRMAGMRTVDEALAAAQRQLDVRIDDHSGHDHGGANEGLTPSPLP